MSHPKAKGAPAKLRRGSVIRSVIFMIWLYGLILIVGVGGTPFLPFMTRKQVMKLVDTWARMVLWGLRVIVGTKVEIRGEQYRPQGGAVVACKHMGMLDTIVPFVFLPDACFVLKRELMKLPAYGSFAIKTKMIPVNRGGRSQAVKDMSAAAIDRVADGRQIFIFPEGTRQAPGVPTKYKIGIAALYKDTKVACVPMATNSGVFWPAHGIVRRPGTVVFEFLEPIPPGLHRGEFMRRLERRIEKATDKLLIEAGFDLPPKPPKEPAGEAASA